MARKAKVKATPDKLTPRQARAVELARDGDYYTILTLIVECDRAIDSVETARCEVINGWADSMIAHYMEVGNYMLSFVKDFDERNLFWSMIHNLKKD